VNRLPDRGQSSKLTINSLGEKFFDEINIDGFVKSRHWCHCERPARHQLRFRRWQAGASPQGEAGGSEAIYFNVTV